MSSSSVRQENRISPWLPISLLAVTTTALAVPIILLRRQRANALVSRLHAAPPPRRSGRNVIPLNQPRHIEQPFPRPKALPLTEERLSASADDFNAPLYTAKAFGFATLLVSTSAVATVLGVKSYLGVSNTEEFAERMRHVVSRKVPILSARIYRPPDEHVVEQHIDTEWNWEDAEKRLTHAFDTGGISAWTEAVVKELETEGRLEGNRRRHESSQPSMPTRI